MPSAFRTVAGCALPLVVVLTCLPLPADAAFDNLYVFGDSLSDVGNVQTVTTGLAPLVPPTPGPYYFNGRYSNGQGGGRNQQGTGDDDHGKAAEPGRA